MVSIDGVTLPGISAYQATHEKIVNFERDSLGNAKGDIINWKWKIQLTFTALTAQETSSILQACSPFSFEVSFYNIETGETDSFTGYEGNKNFPLWRVDPQGGYYTQGGTLNLIEL